MVKRDTMLKVLMLPSSKAVALQVLYLYRVLAWQHCASRVDFWLLGNFFARLGLLYRHFCEPFLQLGVFCGYKVLYVENSHLSFDIIRVEL